jgi:hypothetical protein
VSGARRELGNEDIGDKEQTEQNAPDAEEVLENGHLNLFLSLSFRCLFDLSLSFVPLMPFNFGCREKQPLPLRSRRAVSCGLPRASVKTIPPQLCSGAFRPSCAIVDVAISYLKKKPPDRDGLPGAFVILSY